MRRVYTIYKPRSDDAGADHTVLCLFVSEEETERLGRLALWPLCR